MWSKKDTQNLKIKQEIIKTVRNTQQNQIEKSSWDQ